MTDFNTRPTLTLLKPEGKSRGGGTKELNEPSGREGFLAPLKVTKFAWVSVATAHGATNPLFVRVLLRLQIYLLSRVTRLFGIEKLELGLCCTTSWIG